MPNAPPHPPFHPILRLSERQKTVNQAVNDEQSADAEHAAPARRDGTSGHARTVVCLPGTDEIKERPTRKKTTPEARNAMSAANQCGEPGRTW